MLSSDTALQARGLKHIPNTAVRSMCTKTHRSCWALHFTSHCAENKWQHLHYGFSIWVSVKQPPCEDTSFYLFIHSFVRLLMYLFVFNFTIHTGIWETSKLAFVSRPAKGTARLLCRESHETCNQLQSGKGVAPWGCWEEDVVNEKNIDIKNTPPW